MDRKMSLLLSGICIILAGIVLLICRDASFETIRQLLLATLLPALLMGVLTVVKRYREKVQFVYHEIHTYGLLIYLLAIWIYCRDFNFLNKSSMFLFMYYSIAEIIFCSLLFNLKGKVIFSAFITRIFFSLVIGIGTTIISSTQELTQATKIMGYGIIFILMGINAFLYQPILREQRLPAKDNGAF